MKKILTLLLFCLSLSVMSQTVTDIEGNTYKTAKIGNQVWMQENLRVTKFNDGTPILKEDLGCLYCYETSTSMNWDTLQPMYAIYPNSDIVKNGLLYNSIVTDTKNVCPIGWHVPSVEEFDTLVVYTGGNYSSYLLGTEFNMKSYKHHRPKNYLHGEPTTFSRSELVSSFWTKTKITHTINYTCGIVETRHDHYSYKFYTKGEYNHDNISIPNLGETVMVKTGNHYDGKNFNYVIVEEINGNKVIVSDKYSPSTKYELNINQIRRSLKVSRATSHRGYGYYIRCIQD